MQHLSDLSQARRVRKHDDRSVVSSVVLPTSNAGQTVPSARNTTKPDFVCDDPNVQRSMVDIAGAVALRMPVCITGETGTGKELMARHVHQMSGRKGEFVALNCGAIPESLFIAEIFGHERGAFTNARAEGQTGLARAADRGTLFLDEVADIPLAAQTALLRFLDSMEVRAVGGHRTYRIDVQIISATNRDLGEMVHCKQFRSDLYYRLNAFTLHLPPLRTRSDFTSLVYQLIEEISPGAAVTDAAIEILSRQDWPGNIRELKTVLQRGLIRSRCGIIDHTCLDRGSPEFEDDSCQICRSHPLSRTRCREIRAAFRASNGNISQVAKQLAVSRTTVYKHLR